jgi:hypothetical protein
MYVCMHVYIRVFVHARIHKCVRMYTCIYVFVYTWFLDESLKDETSKIDCIHSKSKKKDKPIFEGSTSTTLDNSKIFMYVLYVYMHGIENTSADIITCIHIHTRP